MFFRSRDTSTCKSMPMVRWHDQSLQESNPGQLLGIAPSHQRFCMHAGKHGWKWKSQETLRRQKSAGSRHILNGICSTHLHDLVGQVTLRQFDGHVEDLAVVHLCLGVQHLRQQPKPQSCTDLHAMLCQAWLAHHADVLAQKQGGGRKVRKARP